ncbi:MAG TPA: hypothetical protein GXZ87_07665 [Bacteroidales bacterium]|nr:hypothetical protein [Bacteroidales bacterium]
MTTLLKARVAGIDFADVITNAGGLASASWEAQPLTLRDDEVSIVEGDPTEEETFSHENDAPEDYDITGTGVTAVGSFIKVTLDQMASLLGGSVSGASPNGIYANKAKKSLITKAVRFRLKKGGAIVIPKASGYVLFNGNLGNDGLVKLPFKFKALAQSTYKVDGEEVDFVIQETATA